MEPNAYQKKVLGRLREYLNLLETRVPADAYKTLWRNHDIVVSPIGNDSMKPYKDNFPGVPHVCFKVPTGGGKTFIAACAVRYIKDVTFHVGEGAVVWLVPSDAILEQTLANLKNIDHPYRQQLQKGFPCGVEVYSKEQLLNGQNFQNLPGVQEQLSVFVLSYDSFRRNRKNGLLVFRENEKLKDFPVSETLPEGADETSLVNAINVINPIVIVDESHHAAGELSVEMLRNFNPRFILDLTATPRENSNIIAFAEASELKKAHMVKLPLIVYNRADKKDVMADALQLRAQIEQQAIKEEAEGGRYIRPIILFQAQPRGKEDASTFQKLKERLIAGGIPEKEIAIKTATVNELKNVNLMSRDCEIRYIITVNALKEGWDCPFAYILATLANKTSKVDVEQIVGRVLRQPHANKHNQPLLNNAYVLTCSNDFATTLDGIVAALNSSGFSKKDARVAEELPQQQAETPPPEPVQTSLPAPTDDQTPDFLDDDYSDVIHTGLEAKPSPVVEAMMRQAEKETQEYEQETEESDKLGYLGGLEGAMMRQYKMNEAFREEAEALVIPQFCFPGDPYSILPDEFVKLDKKKLSAGFSLSNADSNVNFSLSSGDIYSVDATDSGVQYKKMTAADSKYIRGQLERKPDDDVRKQCIGWFAKQLYESTLGEMTTLEDIYAYVGRVVGSLKSDDFSVMQTGLPFYAGRIKQKIESLLDDHREKSFNDMLDTRDILCRPLFELQKVITPTDTLDGLVKSLYESEAAMNATERKIIEEIVSLSNVKWWHRIAERKPYSFYLNGFINHYPDFMVMTDKGTLVIIEVKGDDRDNSDSERKLRLGRKWADKAGDSFRYFMVFDKLNWHKDGAYDLSEFMGRMERL